MVGTVLEWLKGSTMGLLVAGIGIGAFVWGWNKIDAQEKMIIELREAVAQNERVIEGYKQDMLLHKKMILSLEKEKKVIEDTVQEQKKTLDVIMEDKNGEHTKDSEVLRMRLSDDVIGILHTDPSAVP